MVLQLLSDQAEHIIDMAKSFGASRVGISHAVSLRNSLPCEANAVMCEKSVYHESPRMCVKYYRACGPACPVGVSSYG